MTKVNRREFLSSAAILALPLQQSEKLSVIDGGGANVVAFFFANEFVLVDSGAGPASDVLVALGSTFKVQQRIFVQTLFNTHYHVDQTRNNPLFLAAGAKIIAHQHTRQWMSTDYWVPAEDRFEKARPMSAWPTETFQTSGTLKAGTEQIEYGHLPLAHTDGDIYVFFKTSNVLAVGDVASPLRDPALDWFTGAWIGGRVDAMDTILKLSNEETRIVPAYGPLMTRAEFKAERDMMEEVRARVWKQTLQGDSPREMLEAGVLKGLSRTWKDPSKFLYDAAKGMFAHHNKLEQAVI
jgi:cyclase